MALTKARGAALQLDDDLLEATLNSPNGFHLVSFPKTQDEEDLLLDPSNDPEYKWGDPLRYGAAGDGVTDDTLPLQRALNYLAYTKSKGFWPKKNFVITSVLTITGPLHLDGGMCQIFQSTANTDGIMVDKGTASLSTNLQNTVVLENIVLGTEAGTGNAFVFRNMNESNIRNLFVPKVGNIAFYFQGCILNEIEHCYTGDGLMAEPGFFKSVGLTSNTTGFQLESYNGTGCNVNSFIRCTSTNSSSIAFNITGGVSNVFMDCDCEGITAPAIGFYVGGAATNIIGGDMEGSGDSIQIWSNGCTITGVNALAGIIVESGVTATTIKGGQIKILNFVAGSFNNSAEGVVILTTGVVVDSGTDNLLINIYDTDTAADKGYFRSGTFTPDLEFGGASGVSAYTSLAASWWRNGNICHFSIFIRPSTYTAATGTATINLNDIPFTPRAGVENFPCNVRWNGIAAGAGYILELNVSPGAKTINIERILDSTGVVSSIDHTYFAANDQFKIAGWFAIK